jgi:hypothetical protein
MPLQSVVEDLRRQYRHLRFCFVTAPTERCGITLVQRILNTGRDTIIYGENPWLLYKFPTFLMAHCDDHFDEKKRVTDATRHTFLSGHRAMDATALFPPTLTRETLRQFYHLLQSYQEDSEQHGAILWGMKCPIPDRTSARALFRLLPNPRVIALHRNLFDIARSMHTRWPAEYADADAFRRLGRRWRQNSGFLRRFSGPNVLHINYGQFISNPMDTVTLLEKTLGVKVGRQELQRKINVDSQSQRRPPNDEDIYLSPVPLPAQAAEWLRQGMDEAATTAA